MERLTYQQAYKMIIDAYFNEELNPMDPEFCFCGTLHGGKRWWEGDSSYTGQEYTRMEDRLLHPHIHNMYDTDGLKCIMKTTPEAEEAIFKGMSAALEELKEIHRSRGEDVDTYIPEKQFIKRELVKN